MFLLFTLTIIILILIIITATKMSIHAQITRVSPVPTAVKIRLKSLLLSGRKNFAGVVFRPQLPQDN